MSDSDEIWLMIMACRTDICKGACCRFLTFNFDKKLDDDIKYFLKLHGVEVAELWVTKYHHRQFKTIIQVPLQCKEFDPITFECRVYDKRPRNCMDNRQLISPFLPKEICSVMTPALSDAEINLTENNNKDDEHKA